MDDGCRGGSDPRMATNTQGNCLLSSECSIDLIDWQQLLAIGNPK
jgi:hypothetical protein